MKTIIIATDFSSVAANATRYGIDMAAAIQSDILLFHTYELPVNMAEVPVVMIPADEMKTIAEEKLLALKKEMEAFAPATMKIDIMAALGDTTNELQELCDKIKPFAIVMGTHSVANIERILFGSTTLKVIHYLCWPVITVPPGKKFGEGIKKIGFACELNAVTNSTPVHIIKEFVHAFHSELMVLNADLPNHNLQPDIEKQSHMLYNMLKEVNPGFHFIQVKDIEEGINDFADSNNIDLLITIPKKHKLLEHIFRSGSTKKLVFHSHIPVMCLHE